MSTTPENDISAEILQSIKTLSEANNASLTALHDTRSPGDLRQTLLANCKTMSGLIEGLTTKFMMMSGKFAAKDARLDHIRKLAEKELELKLEDLV